MFVFFCFFVMKTPINCNLVSLHPRRNCLCKLQLLKLENGLQMRRYIRILIFLQIVVGLYFICKFPLFINVSQYCRRCPKFTGNL